MNTIFPLILIAISLSMDAFSLSLIYGMNPLENKDKILLSSIVGLYHFFMPLIGLFFGNIISHYININIIGTIILLYIGLDLIISKEHLNPKLSLLGFILFGISVSIDSFSIGISLKVITNYIYLSPIIFSITSSIFTYIGLISGNYISNKIGYYSKSIGGIILIIIAIFIYIT